MKQDTRYYLTVTLRGYLAAERLATMIYPALLGSADLARKAADYLELGSLPCRASTRANIATLRRRLYPGEWERS
jgi:hypothetical protein